MLRISGRRNAEKNTADLKCYFYPTDLVTMLYDSIATSQLIQEVHCVIERQQSLPLPNKW